VHRAETLIAAIERAEAHAWAEIQRAVAPGFRDRFGVTVREVNGAVMLQAPKTDMLALNRVLGLGVAEPLREETLDQIVASYREAGIPRFIVQWPPDLPPADASDWFAARGFRAAHPMAKLYRRADDPLSHDSDLAVREIGESEAELFGATAAAGNELEPHMASGFDSTVGRRGWIHYLAWDGARPVAAAALFVHGEVGWCGFAGTLLGDRGRGAQSALLARRVRDAAVRGCRWVTAETMADTPERPSASFRNMRRMGFDVAYLRTNYLLTPG
jgi:hypothetical protein